MSSQPTPNGSGSGSTRPVKIVLGDALDELRERESLLARFAEELAEVRAAIKALSRLVETDAHPQATRKNVAGECKQAILAAVRDSPETLTMEEIAKRIDRKPAGWLAMQCNRLVDAGELVRAEGGYGLPNLLGVATE